MTHLFRPRAHFYWNRTTNYSCKCVDESRHTCEHVVLHVRMSCICASFTWTMSHMCISCIYTLMHTCDMAHVNVWPCRRCMDESRHTWERVMSHAWMQDTIHSWILPIAPQATPTNYSRTYSQTNQTTLSHKPLPQTTPERTRKVDVLKSHLLHVLFWYGIFHDSSWPLRATNHLSHKYSHKIPPQTNPKTIVILYGKFHDLSHPPP